MGDTTFIANTTVIPSEWCNEVNNLVHKIFGDPGITTQLFYLTGDQCNIGDYGFEESGININGVTYAPKLRVNDIGGSNPAQFVVHRHSTTLAPVLIGARSDSDDNTHSAVTNGQDLLLMYGAGWSGSHYDLFGSVEVSVDASGTISAISSPGRVSLKAVPDGSNILAPALTIDGNVTAGNTRLLVYDVDDAALSRVKSDLHGIIQTVEATPYVTYSTHTTVIPQDNSIPQNIEGDEILTVSIAPKSATNRLLIIATSGVATVPGNSTMALFQDSGVDALTSIFIGNAGSYLVYEMAAGTTSSITFKIRIGPTSGSLYLNGNAGTRVFGGVSAVRLRVEEISVSSGPRFLSLG